MSRFREGQRVEVTGAFNSANTPLENGTYYDVSASPGTFETPQSANLKATPKFAIQVHNRSGGNVSLDSGNGFNEFDDNGAETDSITIANGATVTVWYDDSVGENGRLKVQR